MIHAKISSVEEVRFYIFRIDPVFIAITAEGRAVSTGWQGTLTPISYEPAPTDGILEFDFNASIREEQKVVRTPTPISASLSLAIPSWAQGIRVHASANTLDGKDCSASLKPMANLKVGNNPVPWPWNK